MKKLLATLGGYLAEGLMLAGLFIPFGLIPAFIESCLFCFPFTLKWFLGSAIISFLAIMGTIALLSKSEREGKMPASATNH